MFTTPSVLSSMPVLLGVLAVAAVAGGAGGYTLGQRVGSASGDAGLARLQASHAAALANASEQARARERTLNLAAVALQAQLETARLAHARESDQLKGRIASVTAQYRPSAQAPLQAAPRCVFTNGFASVWNSAIGAAEPATVAAAAADPAGGTAEAAGATEALDSGIQPADVLGHVIDYGARCRDIESQLNRLIDYQQRLDRP